MKKVVSIIKKFIEKPEYIFLLFGLLGGCLFSFLIPVLQVPDEYDHIRYMCNAFGTPELFDEMSGTVFLNSSSADAIGNADVKIDKEKYKASLKDSFTTKKRITDLRLSKRSIWYLPCAIGFYISYFIGAKMLVCLQVGELFSLLFYLGMGYLSITQLPIKKRIMTFWLLAPMTIQQCSSYNYDAVLIPCCFLLISYLLKLKIEDNIIKWRNIILPSILLLIIAIVKLPYLLIAGILFTIPLDKYDLKIGRNLDLVFLFKKYRFLLISLFIITMICMLYILRNNTFIKLLFASILEIDSLLRMFVQSCKELHAYYLVTLVGSFAWLDTNVSSIYCVIFFSMFTYIFISDTDNAKEKRVGKVDRIVIILLCISMLILIMISMLTWSFYVYGLDITGPLLTVREGIRTLSRFDGVQSRYFIPFIPLLCVAFKSKGINNEKNFLAYDMFFYLFSISYVCSLLIHRFWG